MMWLKGCRRCRGDLYLERDVGSSRVVCLQCGYVAAEVQDHRTKEPVRATRREGRRRAEPVPAA
jgi:transcription initiation factor TFIIIB Brf1 subunit/transcription initiation factor TFIIB